MRQVHLISTSSGFSSQAALCDVLRSNSDTRSLVCAAPAMVTTLPACLMLSGKRLPALAWPSRSTGAQECCDRSASLPPLFDATSALQFQCAERDVADLVVELLVLALQERIAVLLRRDHLLDTAVPERGNPMPKKAAAKPKPTKNAVLRRLRRSSRWGSRLIRITARTSAWPSRKLSNSLALRDAFCFHESQNPASCARRG